MSQANTPAAGPLVLTGPLPGLAAALEAAGFRVLRWPRNAEELARVQAAAGEIEAIAAQGGVRPPRGVMDAAARLSLICCVGAGYEAYDPQSLAARGVRLANGGGANGEDVADMALALLLAARRQVTAFDREVRGGRWAPRMVSRIRGRKLGVLGLGSIGQAVAQRAEAFGMEVGWYGPNPKSVKWPRLESPMALAQWADDLAVTCRPTPENERLVGADMLRALGPSAIVVNVARGSVVDEPALIEALKAGVIGGAGLDVFAAEPTDSALWAEIPNVVLTPHVGSATHESIGDLRDLCVENLRRHFAGEALLTPLN